MTEKEFYALYHKLIWAPNHPCVMVGGCVYEYRLEVEAKIGRYLLPTEQVHHHYLWDGSCYLAVCKGTAEHMEMHTCEEAYRYSGYWNWRKCKFCKQYDDPKNLKDNSHGIYHKSCATEYDKDYRQRKEE